MENWTRLSADVTHYGGRCYLSVLDYGPSRFAVWRCIPNEKIDAIRTELEQLLCERGSPVDLLMDNSTVCRSSSMRTLLDKWGVMPLYRAAFKPSGNGIVERNHRTIKRMAARSNSDTSDMVFWYNICPKSGMKEDSVPAKQLHKYHWRTIRKKKSSEVVDIPDTLQVGQRVFVKPSFCVGVLRSGQMK